MYRKTLLYYAKLYLLFTLFVVLAFSPVWRYANQKYREQEMRVAQQWLEDGAGRFSDDLYEVVSASRAIQTNRNYTDIAMRSLPIPLASTVALANLQSMFSSMFLATSNINDYGVLLTNGITLTRMRCIQDGALYPDYLSMSGVTKDDWNALIASKRLCILPETTVTSVDFGQYDALPVMYCSSPIEKVNSIALYAMIPSACLMTMLAPADMRDDCGLRMTDGAGNLLMERPSEPSSNVIRYTVPDFDIHIALTITESTLTLRMHDFLSTLVGGYAFVSMLAFVLSILFAVLANHPIRKIAKPIMSASRTSLKDDTYFDLIRNSLSDMTDAISELEHTLTAQNELLRGRMLESARSKSWLIRNLSAFRSCFPRFPEHFRLCVIQLDSELDEEAMRHHQLALNRILLKHLPPETYCVSFDACLALPLPCTDALENDRRAASLLNALNTYGGSLCCAISNPMTGLISLPEAFSQCSGILLQVNTDERRIWTCDDFPAREASASFGYDDLNNLYTIVVKGDADSARELIYTYYRSICSNCGTNAYIAEQFFYDLRGLLLRLKMEFFEQLRELELPDYHQQNGFDGTLAAFLGCYGDACCILAKHNKACQTTLAEQIKRFLSEHLSDPSLCVQSVSAAFGISASTLQKTLRSHLNKSCAGYVEEQRICKAKKLLTETERSVADIASACGYTATNSFFKAFKRMTNVTPGEWRRINGESA